MYTVHIHNSQHIIYNSHIFIFGIRYNKSTGCCLMLQILNIDTIVVDVRNPNFWCLLHGYVFKDFCVSSFLSITFVPFFRFSFCCAIEWKFFVHTATEHRTSVDFFFVVVTVYIWRSMGTLADKLFFMKILENGRTKRERAYGCDVKIHQSMRIFVRFMTLKPTLLPIIIGFSEVFLGTFYIWNTKHCEC